MTGLLNLQYTDFLNRLKGGEKTDCPCCGRHAQMYHRHLHHNAAKKMVQLYRLGGAVEYIHTSRLIEDGETGAGDFSKGKYWGLIAEAENNWEHKRTSGNWKLTPKGVDFVLGRITIPKTALIFDDRVFGFSEDHVDIHSCLASGGFSYADLMRG